MKKKKGILLKTFLFTSGLITLAVAVSFATLYFILPDYYRYTKNARIKESTGRLVQALKDSGSEAECVTLIADFSVANNAEVLAIDSAELPIPNLSSPFMQLGGTTQIKYGIQIRDMAGAEGTGTGEDKKKRLYTFGSGVNLPVITWIRDIQNGVIDSIIVTSTLQPVDEAKGVILSLMPYLLVIDILIALIAAYFYAKRLTKPILALSVAASAMQQLTPGASSNIRTNDELGELSRNMDAMYQSLWRNMEGLQYEMKRVELLEKSKTDFMRAASHELKTPITALGCITEGMIDNVGVYQNKEKYLSESKRLIGQMAVLVNEILNASRLETIEDGIVMETVALRDIVNQAIDRHRMLAMEKGLDVTITDFEYTYDTDSRILLNTLSNIVSNAFKYTAQGGQIAIALAAVPDGAILSIENQCGPIPEEELPKLFEPFYTLNYSRHRSKSGTGLGLYIVKRNLERLQIPYKMENIPEGIRFSLYFM